MKLIIAIISKEDERGVLIELYKNGFHSARIPSTRSFFRGKGVNLLIGVEDKDADKVVNLIKEKSSKREKTVVNATEIFGMSAGVDASNVETEIGGATIFVLNVESFVKV